MAQIQGLTKFTRAPGTKDLETFRKELEAELLVVEYRLGFLYRERQTLADMVETLTPAAN